MKLTPWLLSALAPLTAVSVLAQASNPVPPVVPPLPPPTGLHVVPAAPAAAEVQPAAKPAPAPKAQARHPRTPLVKSRVLLEPPVPAVVKCEVLDVRGQGSFDGEVITHVKKGETVTVLEEITLSRVRAGEPHQWSRIVMPTNGTVWVDADYVDAATKAVRVKKLNLRGGPGENYSVVGRLDKGTVVNEIRKKEGWLEIEAPSNAFAFVASEYLDKQAAAAPAPLAAAAPAPVTPPPPAPPPAPVVVNVAPETPPAPAAPVETPSATPVAPAPTAASQTEQELAALRRATAPEPMMAPTAAAPAPTAAQPGAGMQAIPRTVTREGFVHRAYNIQAPTGYELHDIKTGELIDYLQPAPAQKKFKAFVGTRVRITGTEFLDANWPRTPVLRIETVDLMP